MRRQLGLPVSVDAWPTLVAQRVPIIIPMHPSTFTMPADWGAHVVCTDFIFLRGLQGDLQGEIAAFDLFCMLLERDGMVQLVYKHAISTVQPLHSLDLSGENEQDD
jgi:RNA chaperone Hfq